MNQAQGNMGGPVGGQPINVGTPNSGGAAMSNGDSVKRLNTAIYDYLLRGEYHDVARKFIKVLDVETKMKDSPGQRGNQQNGGSDGLDADQKDFPNRPDDLPAPVHLGDGPFLLDWWCQFWELFRGHRGKGGKQATLNYIGAQRQEQKHRSAMMGNMDPAAMQNMGRQFMPSMNGNMPMPTDLKRAALVNRNNMPNQLSQAQALNHRAIGQNQQATQMERQSSQMELSATRSGSPGSGDAPSPKRQRLDGGMQQPINQGRPGPSGQMPGQVGPPSNVSVLPAHTQELLRQGSIDMSNVSLEQLQKFAQQPANFQSKSVETYAKSMAQSMSAAMNQVPNSDNMNKGMPPNGAMGSGGQQGSPASNDASGEFYAQPNGTRLNTIPPAMVAQADGGQTGATGNHALQDYQMQLMLLEQQNKKRLLMARQEQDSMAHPGAPGVNGQYAPGTGMSPSNNRADSTPNPNDMSRGTPKLKQPGMSPNGDMAGRNSPAPVTLMDPNQMPPHVRQNLMQQNGHMRPPSSHPLAGMSQQEQVRMVQNNPGLMPNGWQHSQPVPPGMMQGQPGHGVPPSQGPPNMTSRQVSQHMLPPPPPTSGAGGTQPSSPAQPVAPPTPNQGGNKGKPGNKKEPAKKNAKKANAADSEQPPTPTPATPVTPMFPKSGLPNGQNAPQNMANSQQMPNGAQQIPQQDMPGAPFGSLDDPSQFSGMTMEFGNLSGDDVLDNFDFDSFLNTGGDDGLGGFDANMMFGDGALEAGGDMGGN